MAFRDLVEGDCGGPNPLMRFTSHFVQDHGMKEEGVHDLFNPSLREPFESTNSDQLVKQFLEESSVHPQTFKMDHLLQEMRDIDQSVYPPVIAPGVAKELTGQDTAWANQYLQSGGHFDENHAKDIWNSPTTEQSLSRLGPSNFPVGASNFPVGPSNFPVGTPTFPAGPSPFPAATSTFPTGPTTFPSGETNELGLGPKWAAEYLEHNIENPEASTKDAELAKPAEGISTDEPKVAYSKFMKFMRQEESIPIEMEQANKWSSEFTEEKIISETPVISSENSGVLNKVEEELATAGAWVEEFNKSVAQG